MTRRTIVWILGSALIAAAGAIPGDAREVVGIQLHGHYFNAPATVTLLVAVEPDVENRSLRIEADGEDLFRASELTLNGADEKRLHTFTFKGLPAGYYTLRAEVRSTSAVRGMATRDLVVTGAGLR